MGAKKPTRTNEIVCYKPVSFKWVKVFRDRIVSGEEASDVKLFIAQWDCNDGRGLSVKKGETLIKIGGDGEHVQVSRPYGSKTTGTLPLKNLALKSRAHWSCEDVCEYVVKAKCMEIQSYYTDLLEVENPDLVRKQDFDRGTFVSYARKMKFDELVDALENCFEKEPSIDTDTVFIWMDIFCANQPKLTDPLSQARLKKSRYDLLTKGLHDAITQFERKVIVFDDWKKPSPLTRAWCAWEVLGVAIAGHELEIAMTPRQEDSYLSAFQAQKDFEDILNSLTGIDVENSECSNEADEKMIKKQITIHSSFVEVNEKVLSKLREWHVRTVKREVKKVEGSNLDAELLLLTSLSKLLYLQANYVESTDRAMQALDLAKTVYGAEHEYVAVALMNVGRLLSEQGRFNEAEPLLINARKISEKVHGKEDLQHAAILSNLGYWYQVQGNLDSARPLFEEALRIKRKGLGNKRDEFETEMNNLGGLLHAQGNYDEAEELFRELQQHGKESSRDTGPDYAIAINNLAQVLTEKGETKEALELLEDAMKIAEKAFSQKHPLYANCTRNKARCLSKMGKFKKANACFQSALETSLILTGEMNPAVAKIRWWFAESLQAQKELEKSKSQWKKACFIYEAKGLTAHPDYKKCLALWSNQ